MTTRLLTRKLGLYRSHQLMIQSYFIKNIMKILCISLLWPSQKNKNSATQLVQQISNRVKHGVEITLIAPSRVGTSTKIWLDQYQPSPKKFVSLRFLYFPLFHLKSYMVFALNAKLFQRAVISYISKNGGLKQYDVVHIHDTGLGITLAKAIKEITEIPCILTDHGRNPLLSNFQDNPHFIHKAKHYISYFDKVVLVGRPLTSFITSFGASENQLMIIHNGHQPPSENAVEVSNVRARFKGKVIITSIARLYKIKGTDLTLQALKHLAETGIKNWHYLHVGTGPELENLKKIARDNDLTDHIRFLGHLSYKDAMTILSASDIFIMPSWQEAFGIVYIEAMARAKPVIGCLESGGEESIRHSIDGYLARPNNVDDLIEFLTRLVTDPALRQRLGNNGLQRSTEFTWDTNTRKYIKLYNQLTN